MKNAEDQTGTHHILIPTDFTIESLTPLKQVMNDKGDSPIALFFVHGYLPPDGIMDMLFFSKAKVLDELISRDFESGIQILRNKYNPVISAITYDLIIGNTQSYFEHFLESNQIKEIYYPASYQFLLPDKRSFDLTPFINNATIQRKSVNWINTVQSVARNTTLGNLFTNEIANPN